MNNDDKDLETALDDIFGANFIEVDVNQAKKNENLSNNIKKIDTNHKAIDKPTFYLKQIESSASSNLEEEKEITNDLNDKSYRIKDDINKELNVEKNKKKRLFIWLLICFMFMLLIIFILVNYVFGVTKVVNCSSMAEDTGYKYTDEYKITYKKNSISFLENTYMYTALTDDFKSQIEYIKKDRLLYIINSNGMLGFTYLYEISDDFIKIDGYFDFNLIEFNKIDKLDQKQMPIFPITIDSKTTYKKLKKNLENEGYKCIPSK